MASTKDTETTETADLPAETTGSDVATVKAKAKEQVAKAREKVKEEAESLRSQATGKAKGYAAEGKDKATGAIREISGAMDEAARSVDERLGEDYGEYARMAAGAVATFAEKLEAKDIDELIHDAEELVRKSPAVAIGIAAVAGFAMARLIKSGLGEREEA